MSGSPDLLRSPGRTADRRGYPIDSGLRVVTVIPLEELWDGAGPFGRRVACLTLDEVRAFLKFGPVRLAEVDVGKPLKWTERKNCFARWKQIVPHIADPDEFRLEDFPEDWALVASEWEGRSGERLIVFEKHH